MIKSPQDLPWFLSERTRSLNKLALRTSETYVLYWMRTALRTSENPALDVALCLSEALNLPLLVYQGLSEKTPYANDRHHRFILEGAKDVAGQFGQKGISYALHVERPGAYGPHLKELLLGSAVMVTEDMPVSPLRNWTKNLALKEVAPVWAVDTACVVPMLKVGKAYTRAFQYRKAIEPLVSERLQARFGVGDQPKLYDLEKLPFAPIDILNTDLSSLIASCEIDHTVGPVSYTPGGSAAGYARWNAFRENKLGRYASDRNDPNKHGVSRLSPYLHYGMVSAHRLLREAREKGGKGAEKFEDELLVWRELAYTWCLYSRHHENLEALPTWAKSTLNRHEQDTRKTAFDGDTLARGKTGIRLWDVAQQSLTVQGELHNNVRMTWGKAFLEWGKSPRQSLANAIENNHRYALDGRDPASYGGLLWCFGQFDRPFTPERPVFGTVRPRSIAQHAKRLDVERWQTHIKRYPRKSKLRVGVVGAGLAAAFCARVLQENGCEVVAFDKGRGPGGRLSTRNRKDKSFDHGTAQFTLTHPVLERFKKRWQEAGAIAPWKGKRIKKSQGRTFVEEKSVEYWVGKPTMSGFVEYLLKGVDVNFLKKASNVSEAGIEFDDGQCFECDFTVMAIPAPQALTLLPDGHALRPSLERVEYSPCWSLLAHVDLKQDVDFVQATLENDDVIKSVFRNQTKHALTDGERWTVHATSLWSKRHLELSKEKAALLLSEALIEKFAYAGVQISESCAHRWRYSRVLKSLSVPTLCHENIGLCGDGVLGDGVEKALLSAAAMAGVVMGLECK